MLWVTKRNDVQGKKKKKAQRTQLHFTSSDYPDVWERLELHLYFIFLGWQSVDNVYYWKQIVKLELCSPWQPLNSNDFFLKPSQDTTVSEIPTTEVNS